MNRLLIDLSKALLQGEGDRFNHIFLSEKELTHETCVRFSEKNHFQIIEEVILISLAEDNGSNAKDINDFCNSSSSMCETVIELGLDNKSALSGVSLFSMIEGHCSYE